MTDCKINSKSLIKALSDFLVPVHLSSLASHSSIIYLLLPDKWNLSLCSKTFPTFSILHFCSSYFFRLACSPSHLCPLNATLPLKTNSDLTLLSFSQHCQKWYFCLLNYRILIVPPLWHLLHTILHYSYLYTCKIFPRLPAPWGQVSYIYVCNWYVE